MNFVFDDSFVMAVAVLAAVIVVVVWDDWKKQQQKLLDFVFNQQSYGSVIWKSLRYVQFKF